MVSGAASPSPSSAATSSSAGFRSAGRSRRSNRPGPDHETPLGSYDTRQSHTAKDVLAFFKLIDLHVAKDLEIHVVLDNLSAHKAPPVAEWLAHPKRARWHLHFTPTSSSWLNLVEGWFSLLTKKRLQRGVFNSIDALTEAIEVWTEHWNDDPKPFIWTKTAEAILTKQRRARAAVTASANSATHH